MKPRFSRTPMGPGSNMPGGIGGPGTPGRGRGRGTAVLRVFVLMSKRHGSWQR
jgi:hypothetical protein